MSRQVCLTWRYALRWANPHTTPTGPLELMAVTVPAGTRTPPEITARWRPGTGYAVCIDFDMPAIKPWSPERKGRVRVARLRARLQKAAPLFLDELMQRELGRRPDYFAGQ